MKMKYQLVLLISLLGTLVFSCKMENEEPATPTPTLTEEDAIAMTISRPIQKQWKGLYAFNDSTLFFDNQFDGARLNGVLQTDTDHFTILISAENYPINPSPWYAFKVYGQTEQNVTVTFTYQESRNRYFPKLSKDGINWQVADSSSVTLINKGEGQSGISAAHERMEIVVPVSEVPIWIAAQEVVNSGHVKEWIGGLSKKAAVSAMELGSSKEGRVMQGLQIGTGKKAVMIISRQHPPEVTGFLVMKAFIEAISEENELTAAFQGQYTTFVAPLMNPDGVDNGHWRHNAGGIDLNRDWSGFNQPETSAIKTFIQGKEQEGYDFKVGIDFHSTWKDVYYPYDSSITENKGGLIYKWIRGIDRALPGYTPNIEPSTHTAPYLYSRNYFGGEHEMEAIIFEMGDNTPRDFIETKGEAAAKVLMELLVKD